MQSMQNYSKKEIPQTNPQFNRIRLRTHFDNSSRRRGQKSQQADHILLHQHKIYGQPILMESKGNNIFKGESEQVLAQPQKINVKRSDYRHMLAQNKLKMKGRIWSANTSSAEISAKKKLDYQSLHKEKFNRVRKRERLEAYSSRLNSEFYDLTIQSAQLS